MIVGNNGTFLVFWEGKSRLLFWNTFDISIDLFLFSTDCIVFFYITDACMTEDGKSCSIPFGEECVHKFNIVFCGVELKKQ